VNGQKFVYKFVQFPDNFSPAQIEISDVDSPPTLCHPSLPSSSTGPPTLLPNYHKMSRAEKHDPYPKASPKKRSRGQQRPMSALNAGSNGVSDNSNISMFDLLTLAASSLDQSPSILPLQLMDQSESRNTGSQSNLPMPWSINQLLALQYLAELNQNNESSPPMANRASSVGSDGEVASSCSVSPESKNRSGSISPTHPCQDEPLDLSKPKRMKLAISATDEKYN